MAVERDALEEAIEKRANYIKGQAESLTLKKFRRVLESDLGLSAKELDTEKEFIEKKVDSIISQQNEQDSLDEEEDAVESEEGSPVNESRQIGVKDSNGSDGDEGDSASEESGEEQRPARTSRKAPPKAAKAKPAKRGKSSDGEGEEDEGDTDSEEENRPAKKSRRETAPKSKTPAAYLSSKQVTKLKEVIKQCGLKISPAVYKRAKDAPGHKAEAVLIEQLEGILAKEGLSSDPSEKEIRRVRQKKDRQKELDGIDATNIVESGRPRRAAVVAKPPPKYKAAEDGDEEEDEDEEEESEDEDDLDEEEKYGEEVEED